MSEGEAESNLYYCTKEDDHFVEHGTRPMSKKFAQAKENKRMNYDIEADIQIRCYNTLKWIKTTRNLKDTKNRCFSSRVPETCENPEMYPDAYPNMNTRLWDR